MHIPFESRTQDGQPLQAVLERTAARSGLSPATVAIIASHFFELLSDELARGRCVNVVGFGKFGPWLVERPSERAKGGPPRCKVVFSPSRGLAQQVAVSAPPNVGPKRQLARHRRNHGAFGRRGREQARVFTAMQAFRDQLTAQLGGEHAPRDLGPN
ncbi:MAG: HU family DNA-binding protein [Planctomycetes bacterium]|nr:HU family DNA-binding protein [Planctomycetota bacterium]